ncbi:MAG: N-acetylmuramyl-L-alanine amidase [Candidatus Nitrohelix vancouverensis]|uniref:N-acetylmuramyl-L-alanine amidase n=1 Tax=Candidatus Nitrohelix vancouverensis TaxID=2705534 RepID=A0A7T0C1G1_9BACT|nr:MAG: N-acetylmuramyl-L-alanine amidase [Candidatus Nitrohelix vancouverensis]
MAEQASEASADNSALVVCGQRIEAEVPIILWTDKNGYACPNKRGRARPSQHDATLNDAPTRPHNDYLIHNPTRALEELRQTVHQLVLHYDASYCSRHCHEWMENSDFKGSHFYLDLDGTIYQTCDLYWKTNTAPADDRQGNERAVHIEMSNLAWEALADESELYQASADQYQLKRGEWELQLPEKYRKTMQNPSFRACSARAHATRGYFSRKINGKMVRMWDFTEAQYQALIPLCRAIHRALPRIELEVPFDSATGRTPLDRIDNFSSFAGILGHAHVQNGSGDKVACKYDPGSAFDWARLRRAFRKK